MPENTSQRWVMWNKKVINDSKKGHFFPAELGHSTLGTPWLYPLSTVIQKMATLFYFEIDISREFA